jgi:hypothetical protein
MPIPNNEYWVDRSKLQYSGTVLKCLKRGVCKGQNLNILQERVSAYSSQLFQVDNGNLSCWSLYAYNQTKVDAIFHEMTNDDDNYHGTSSSLSYCNSDELQCQLGSVGVLCGSCDVGYSVKRGDGCQRCSQSWLQPIITCLVLLLFGIGILLYRQYRPFHINTDSLFHYIDYLYLLDEGKFRVLWSNYQIIHSIEWNLEIDFPRMWRKVNNSLGFLSLNIVPLNCVYGSDRLSPFLVLSIAPIIVGFVIAMRWLWKYFWLENQSDTGFIKNKAPSSLSVASPPTNSVSDTASFKKPIAMLGSYNSYNSSRNISSASSASSNMSVNGTTNNMGRLSSKLPLINKLRNDHTYYLLLLGYLVLPIVTSTQLQALDCVTVSGKRYVRTDTLIECDGKKYNLFAVWNIIFLGLYLIIPLIWLRMLHAEEPLLKPKSSEESVTKYYRDNEPKLAPLRFLFDPYKARYYYFEVIEMYRRIFFVGVIPLLSEKMDRRGKRCTQYCHVVVLTFSLLNRMIRMQNVRGCYCVLCLFPA